jgi:dTDP-glucose pyrophosphorylase
MLRECSLSFYCRQRDIDKRSRPRYVMYMKTKPRTLREITDLFAKTLLDATGANVEVVSRGRYFWSFVGQPDDVRKAVEYVQTNKLMFLEQPVEHDEELDESFAYLDDRATAQAV